MLRPRLPSPLRGQTPNPVIEHFSPFLVVSSAQTPNPVIHRDLKPANCLLDRHGVLKLAVRRRAVVARCCSRRRASGANEYVTYA